MKLHREILGRRQRKALMEIGPAAAATGFYLGGGTALALRLGHRLSVVLDWFSDSRLGDPARLAAALREAGVPLVTTMMAEGTLYGTVERVPTSFLQYPYARLRPLGRARGFRIASLDDLACMKFSAIVDRKSEGLRGRLRHLPRARAAARPPRALRQAFCCHRPGPCPGSPHLLRGCRASADAADALGRRLGPGEAEHHGVGSGDRRAYLTWETYALTCEPLPITWCLARLVKRSRSRFRVSERDAGLSPAPSLAHPPTPLLHSRGVPEDRSRSRPLPPNRAGPHSPESSQVHLPGRADRSQGQRFGLHSRAADRHSPVPLRRQAAWRRRTGRRQPGRPRGARGRKAVGQGQGWQRGRGPRP